MLFLCRESWSMKSMQKLFPGLFSCTSSAAMWPNPRLLWRSLGAGKNRGGWPCSLFKTFRVFLNGRPSGKMLSPFFHTYDDKNTVLVGPRYFLLRKPSSGKNIYLMSSSRSMKTLQGNLGTHDISSCRKQEGGERAAGGRPLRAAGQGCPQSRPDGGPS